MNKSELDYIANVLSHREFKHFFSVELSSKEFKANGTDWAIEQALSNFDSEQIGEYNDGENELPWGGSYSVFDNGTKKVTIHVFYDVYRYLVIDVNSLAVVFDTDFLSDAKITESDVDYIVYDTKDKNVIQVTKQVSNYL